MTKTTQKYDDGSILEHIELAEGETIPACGSSKKLVKGPGKLRIFIYPSGARDMIIDDGCRIIYRPDYRG